MKVFKIFRPILIMLINGIILLSVMFSLSKQYLIMSLTTPLEEILIKPGIFPEFPGPSDPGSSPSGTDFTYGPQLDQFPAGINPLTGLPVSSPDLLTLPAVLMAVTDYPPKIRPQAGLSYAPQIYEIYIGEGMTRFLATWYGAELNHLFYTIGDKPVNLQTFKRNGIIAGDRIWFDKNENGIQDEEEGGIGGVQIDLLDNNSKKLIESTTTNSEGLFGFNVEKGNTYQLHFVLPPTFKFSPQASTTEPAKDSNADEATGLSEIFTIMDSDMLDIDAGMFRIGKIAPSGKKSNDISLSGWAWVDNNGNGIQDKGEYGFSGIKVDLMDKKMNVIKSATTEFSGTYSFEIKPGDYIVRFKQPENYNISPRDAGVDDRLDSDVDAKGWTKVLNLSSNEDALDAGFVPPVEYPVGPARSGRAAFTPVVDSFGPDACLIAASKDPTVPVQLCRYVYGSPDDVETAGVKPGDILKIAKNSKQFDRNPNYSGNIIASRPPEGGKDAQELLVFFSQKNQSIFRYDEMVNQYIRYDDRDAEGKGKFVPSTDRLNGQRIALGNVIILVVEHKVDRRFVFSLNMTNAVGKAIVLRDGKIYENLMWSTIGEEYEKTSMLRRPVKIRYDDKITPFPLAPGNSWFIIAAPRYDLWEPDQEGSWKFRYYIPVGID